MGGCEVALEEAVLRSLPALSLRVDLVDRLCGFQYLCELR